MMDIYAPESYTKVTNLQNPYDSNKNNLLLMIPGVNDSHIVYMYEQLIIKLSLNYNIFVFSSKMKIALEETIHKHCYKMLNFKRTNVDLKLLKRVTDYQRVNENSYIEFFQPFYTMLIGNNEISRIVCLGGSGLVHPPKQYGKGKIKKYKESFHEYPEKDEINKILDNNYLLNFPLSFVTILYGSITNIFLVIMSNKFPSIKFDMLVCDTSVNTAFYKKLYTNHTFYYFVDDNRFGRNYKEFPIGKLTYTNLKNLYPSDNEKTIDFVFGGRLNIVKGEYNRNNVYERMFKNLNIKNSFIYSPMSLTFTQKTPKNKKEAEIQTSSIINDPIDYFELQKQLSIAKYTFIPRPWTYNDSLSFRIYEAIAHNVMPFLDVDFDVDNLLELDQDILNKLRVDSSDCLSNKVHYYNQNEKERCDIIKQLEHSLIKDGDKMIEDFVK